jgi:hypothetical protein
MRLGSKPFHGEPRHGLALILPQPTGASMPCPALSIGSVASQLVYDLSSFMILSGRASASTTKYLKHRSLSVTARPGRTATLAFPESVTFVSRTRPAGSAVDRAGNTLEFLSVLQEH